MRYEIIQSVVNKISILIELYAKCRNINSFIIYTSYNDREGRYYFGKKLNMEKLFIDKKVLTKKKFSGKREMFDNRRRKTRVFYQFKNEWIKIEHQLYYEIMNRLYKILNLNMPFNSVDLIELNCIYKMLKIELLKRNGK